MVPTLLTGKRERGCPMAKKPTVVYCGEAVITSRSAADRAGVPYRKARAAFRPVEVVVHDFWVSVGLSPTWRADYRLVAQDGRFVVGELRVLPVEKHADPGSWTGELIGFRSRVPAGGLTATILKAVRIGAHITEGRHVLDAIEGQESERGTPTALAEMRAAGVKYFDRPSVTRAGADAGQKGLPLQLYVRAATAYAKAVSAGSRRPVVEAARALRQTPARTRDLVHRARALGLLTTTTQGRAGGALTTRR